MARGLIPCSIVAVMMGRPRWRSSLLVDPVRSFHAALASDLRSEGKSPLRVRVGLVNQLPREPGPLHAAGDAKRRWLSLPKIPSGPIRLASGTP